jgi:hypothetical protein
MAGPAAGCRQLRSLKAVRHARIQRVSGPRPASCAHGAGLSRVGCPAANRPFGPCRDPASQGAGCGTGRLCASARTGAGRRFCDHSGGRDVATVFREVERKYDAATVAGALDAVTSMIGVAGVAAVSQPAQILSLIGAVFLAKTLIGFLREVDAVIAAGRTSQQPADDAPAGPRTADAGGRRRVRMRNYWGEEVAASGKGVSGLPGAPGRRLRELERDWA